MANHRRVTTLHIEGMTCTHCQNKIERKLRGLDGVESVRVSYTKGTADITYRAEIVSLANLKEAVRSAGYRVSPAKPAPSQAQTALRLAGVAIILVALFMLLRQLGALGFLDVFPRAQSGMGYGLLFVIGLLTSLHCVVMCGGINLSQCAAPTVPKAPRSNASAALRPGFLYNLGRVISYTAIGALAGGLGSVVGFSGTAKGIVQLVAGVFMVIMGLNMLDLFPWLKGLTPRLPRFLTRLADNGQQHNSPFYVGLLNGLMPCGPLQTMQILALSTGSPLKGALSMLCFSLGTVPLMFGFGALSTLLNQKFSRKMMTVSAALVVVLGVFMFQNGLSLSGFQTPPMSVPFQGQAAMRTPSSVQSVSAAPTPAADMQVITTQLSPRGYTPISVKAGVPVKWVIQAAAEDLTGCNNELVIPAFQIDKQLQPGDNVIEFTPDQSGTIPYSCWMGMIRSTITVTE